MPAIGQTTSRSSLTHDPRHYAETFGHLRPSGHIFLTMEVIEALRTSILVPHDRLHIKHESAFVSHSLRHARVFMYACDA